MDKTDNTEGKSIGPIANGIVEGEHDPNDLHWLLRDPKFGKKFREIYEKAKKQNRPVRSFITDEKMSEHIKKWETPAASKEEAKQREEARLQEWAAEDNENSNKKPSTSKKLDSIKNEIVLQCSIEEKKGKEILRRFVHKGKRKIYRNKNNQWELLGPPELEEFYEELFKKEIPLPLGNTDKNLSELNIGLARSILINKMSEDNLEGNRHYVYCRSKIYNAVKRKFVKYTNEEKTTFSLPFDFETDPEFEGQKATEKSTENLNKIIKRVFPKEDDLLIFQRLVGEIFMGNFPNTESHILVFHGPPRTGKSTLIDILFKPNLPFIPKFKITQLRDETKNQKLVDPRALLSIQYETPASDQFGKDLERNCGDLCSTSTGEPLLYRGLFQNQEEGIARCKFLIVSNHIPNLSKSIDGTVRRLVPFNFAKPYPAGRELSKKQILQLQPAVHNFILKSIHTYWECLGQEMKTSFADEYFGQSSSSIGKFLQEKCLVVEGANEIIMVEFRRVFEKWADAHGENRKYENVGVEIARFVRSECPNISDTRQVFKSTKKPRGSAGEILKPVGTWRHIVWINQ